MQLLSITWNIDPEIFSIGPLSIRYYGILFALAFILGYLIFRKIYKKEGYSEELLDKLTWYMGLGTIIGARLGHCLFYGPQFDVYDANGVLKEEGYLSNPINIFKIWEGGLASHGAAIGILIALYLYVRKYKFEYLWLLDRIGIVVALGGVFIRLGNLMNSEIYGHETNLPWGFIFRHAGEEVAKHPTQIYEALSYLLIFFTLYSFYNKGLLIKAKGKLFGLFLILLFSARFFIEFVKNVQSDFEFNLPINMGQILSIPFILVGVYLLFFYAKGNLKK